MANLIIKASSGNSLVVQGADDSPAITVATDGATTFAENATLAGTLGVTGATTFAETATFSGGAIGVGGLKSMQVFSSAGSFTGGSGWL